MGKDATLPRVYFFMKIDNKKTKKLDIKLPKLTTCTPIVFRDSLVYPPPVLILHAAECRCLTEKDK